ncbi:MAG: BamA/TamA family outer membrane protein, partial [Bacteroidaceae bacterium]|nr:BamA/TamA family outer membrane protein [Bacteroidaceae bacterium]
TRNRMKIDNKYPDSWEAGLDASITYPWLVLPKLGQRYFKYPASTTFSIKIDNLKRAGYYRLVSSEIGATYNFQTSKYITHQFSPLMLTYNHLINATDKFFDIAFGKQALFESISDRLIPAMLYTFKYDNNSNTHLRNTTRFTFTIKESANLINGILALCGKDWNEKDKGFLDTPYSQFTKFQMELANRFRLTDKSMIATRLLMGVLFNYGNSVFVPYSELFYSGGPNSIRAFGVRTIGPGSYDSREFSDYTYYLDRTGNFKLEANVEYRFNIVSNLNGALFVDAGNVWLTKDTDYHPGGLLSDKGFLNSIALGTGFGFRYDMEYLVLRLDFGIGIHSPYSTKKSYYNIEKFRDGIGIHFAVGYPF